MDLKGERIAVVDDSVKDAEEIRKAAEAVFTGSEISVFHNEEDFLSSFEGGDYLLVILDIMIGSTDGIALSQKIRDRVGYILFVTSYPEKVWNAFQYKVIGFLLKTAGEKELREKLMEVRKNWIGSTILLHTEIGEASIHCRKIMYAGMDGSKLSCMMENGLSVRLKDTTLEKLETSASCTLFRINRSELVNPDHVVKKEGLKLTMRNGQELYLSRRKEKAFETMLLRRFV